jgi:hypothetical protein
MYKNKKNGLLSNQIVIKRKGVVVCLLQKDTDELPSCDNYVNLHFLYFYTSRSMKS